VTERISRALTCSLVAGALTLAAGPAFAQGLAVRGGATINPDQFAVGGQYELPLVGARTWLHPNAELGFGDNATLLALNFDVVYRKPLNARSIWTGYAGAGPALNWIKVDGFSQTEAGVNVLGGLMHSSGLFTELRVGFIESPHFAIGAGYAFGRSRPAARTPAGRRR
jgi:hypothetical protein